MALFKRGNRTARLALGPLEPDERAVFDAALAGDGPGMAALRAQAERGYRRGLVRQSFSFSYQVILVINESVMAQEALPGLPNLVIDDVLVRAEELPDALVALARVQDGSLVGLDVRAHGRREYPKHLTFTSVSYRQSDGTEGPLRDRALLVRFERALAPTVTAQAAPDWLIDSSAALRPAPRLSGGSAQSATLGHRDVETLAQWVLPSRFGWVMLLGGDEFFATGEGEVVIANGLDGSAYSVTANGRVRHHALDRSPPEDLGPLRTWLHQVGREGG